LRRPKLDSQNQAWQNASFRGYADYMQTAEFRGGLRELNQKARKRRVCIMCSEAVWWRCHRRLVADAELARNIPVKHIMTQKIAKPHELTEFAVVKRTRGKAPAIKYPLDGRKLPTEAGQDKIMS
jgi:uncharacterized protein (DUF488 family)